MFNNVSNSGALASGEGLEPSRHHIDFQHISTRYGATVTLSAEKGGGSPLR